MSYLHDVSKKFKDSNITKKKEDRTNDKIKTVYNMNITSTILRFDANRLNETLPYQNENTNSHNSQVKIVQLYLNIPFLYNKIL